MSNGIGKQETERDNAVAYKGTFWDEIQLFLFLEVITQHILLVYNDFSGQISRDVFFYNGDKSPDRKRLAPDVVLQQPCDGIGRKHIPVIFSFFKAVKDFAKRQ